MYTIKKEHRVFIDTNILIFLFSPDFVKSKKSQEETYSGIYSKLVENECALYVNSHVISEFINRCLRIDFDKNFQNDKKSKNFKNDYRGSSRYEDTLSLLLKQLKKFTDCNVSLLDDGFSRFNINEEYKEHKNLDFNDLIIAKNVIDNDLKLLTDDQDFSDYKNSNDKSINIYWYLREG